MPACSDVARALGEPLAGTAPHAAIWLAVEQPGPWGAKALIDSHLDHALGAELTRRMADLPVRAVLVRRTGHHADPGPTTPRTVFVARTTGSPRLWRAVVDDPRAVLDLDLHGLVSGAEPTFGAPVTTPVTLVCTNGRRDVCCTARSRAVASPSPRSPPSHAGRCEPGRMTLDGTPRRVRHGAAVRTGLPGHASPGLRTA